MKHCDRKSIHPTGFRATGFAIGLVSLIACITPAISQVPRRGPLNRKPRIMRATAPVEGPERAAEVQKARQILTLFLREGAKKPYSAEQTTRLLSGMVQESTQIVTHGGLGRERIEFTGPPNMKGEVVLVIAGRVFNYKPSANRIFEGVASPEVFQEKANQFFQQVRTGKLRLGIRGQEMIAGQSATIVEILGENGGKRLWIDENTGVRLRYEEMNSQGSVVQTSYFNRIDYTTAPDPKEFRPDSLPNVPHEAEFPKSAPLASVQSAQPLVNFQLHEPTPPSGYHLSGVWVVAPSKDRQVAILRYTDGVRTFAIFQQALPVKAKPGKLPTSIRHNNGVSHWTSMDSVFTLIGNLRRDSVQQIVDSEK
ncbi:MAG: sigma-E factor regulatory protein RseB domain-containing protein [Chthonomonadales bacterium]